MNQLAALSTVAKVRFIFISVRLAEHHLLLCDFCSIDHKCKKERRHSTTERVTIADNVGERSREMVLPVVDRIPVIADRQPVESAVTDARYKLQVKQI
jgi:hypothetical protein